MLQIRRDVMDRYNLMDTVEEMYNFLKSNRS